MNNQNEELIEIEIEEHIKKKIGRPRKIEGETAKERNNVTMRELSKSGYFKKYYQNKKKKNFAIVATELLILLHYRHTKKHKNA